MAGELTTIARPYAEAVFASAQGTSQVDAWYEPLQTLAAIAADPQVAEQIGNPNLAAGRVRDMILGVAGDSLPGELKNLVRLLADNGRLIALPEIAALYEERRVASQGVREVLVRSAFPVDADQEQALATYLSRRLGAQVELRVEQDSDLIGGLEIRAGDLVIDDSVRGKLQQLAHALQF
ncbi:F0F1 ATP synthase subunit delta [uncultured Thiodictyon sp.]|uniref:F0F1 ATP synthase subunit delta n=1 Tax=uncultured Thiodictyon sp. TaxID=1846217 RepID=UPI0025EDBC35|nr:F0F1 ATP synthase subunit delta [uncultured Thiodictyon sp.]